MSIKDWFKGAKAKAMVVLGSFAMILGVGASISIASASANCESVGLNAASSTTSITGASGEVMYVKTSLHSGVGCAVYFWNDTENAWSDNVTYNVYTEGSYEWRPIVLPGTGKVWTGFKITRYSSSQTPSEQGFNENYCWNETGNLAISSLASANTCFYSDYGTVSSYITYTHYGIKSGQQMYLDISDLTGWAADGAKLAVYFGVSDRYSGGGWSSVYDSTHSTLSISFCWLVSGQNNGYLYECIAPQLNGVDVIWNLVVGKRLNSADSDPTGAIWNSTGDLYYNSSIESCNFIRVNANSQGNWSGGGYLDSSSTISSDTRAGYYGTYFLSVITCDSGSIDTAAQTAWASSALVEYQSHLSSEVQYVIWLTTHDGDTGTDLQKAMFRYDYIITKYRSADTYSDFIGRWDAEKKVGKGGYSSNDLNLAHVVLFGPSQDQSPLTLTLWIVLGAGIAGMAAIGAAYFVSKKKKRHQA